MCRLAEIGDKILAILLFLYIHIGKREACYASGHRGAFSAGASLYKA